MEADINSYFENIAPPKKKSKSKWKKHFFMFLSSEWIYIWCVPKPQTQSAYICALSNPFTLPNPTNHDFLIHYTLNTYVPHYYIAGKGYKADYPHNLFTCFFMTPFPFFFITLTMNETRALVNDIMFSWKFY